MIWKRMLVAVVLVSLMVVPMGFASDDPEAVQVTEQSTMTTTTLSARSTVISSTIISSVISTISSSIIIMNSISIIIGGINEVLILLEDLIQQLGENTALLDELQSLALFHEDIDNFDVLLSEAQAGLERTFVALNSAATLGIQASVEAAEAEIKMVEDSLKAGDELIESVDDEVEALDRLLHVLFEIDPGAAAAFADLDAAIEEADEIVETADEIVEATIQLVEAIKEGLKASL